MRTLAKTLLLSAAVLALSAGPASAREGATGQSHDPAGNNGTIKLDRAPWDDAPDNEPHVGCTFQLDFYGFDKGDYNAQVSFEPQAPTADATLSTSDPLSVFIGEDAAGGGTDLDASQTYTLSFTGTPQPQQGYHVKVTIHAPFSQGADVKHKVMWVEPCTTGSTVAPSTGETHGVPSTPGEHHEVTETPAPAAAPATAPSAAAPAAPESSAASPAAEVMGEQVELAAPTAAAATSHPTQVLGESFERGAATSGLAFTGLDTAELLLAGLASLAFGIGLLLATRRRLVRA